MTIIDINLGYPFYKQAFERISIESAWNYTYGIPSIRLGVVDSMLHLNYRGFLHKEVYFCDCQHCITQINDKKNIYDVHGTYCSLLSVGKSEYCIGVAPNVSLVFASLGVLDSDVQIYLTDENKIAHAIDYCAKQKCDVILLPWSWKYSKIVESSIQHCLNHGRNGKGTIIITTAGNYGIDNVFPGSIAGSMCISSIDPHDNIINRENLIKNRWCSGANLNSKIAAPGILYVHSSLPNTNVPLLQGTSISASLVAGIVCLMLSANNTLTNTEVCRILVETSDCLPTKVGDNNECYDRIKLINAVKCIESIISK